MEKDEHCIVCGKQGTEGLFIFNSFVCKNCEQEMVATDACDDKYLYFIKQMRQIWMKQNA
ncbi:sigma factor G inhibitor Gin [Aneurinibacillus terranovensis]|uniref:sigma factor G inhibitor Gin n=1 Tax=Aneurinibacillus terranovensis TaxID=278991 RepID=UPI0003FF237A|nr:sigma factor G inhibitor Gin [Aneurinibacillus terranovensis]